MQLGKNFPVAGLDGIERLGSALSSVLEHARALDAPVPAAKETGADELPHALVTDTDDLGGVSNCDPLGLVLSFHGPRMPRKLCWDKRGLGH